MGLSICYELRFPALYRALAQPGAGILVFPSAFAQLTGEAHWHILPRARAIETGYFVIAAVQTGVHLGSGRKAYGHSLILDLWGQVILDAGQLPGLHFVELYLTDVDKVRAHMASLACGRHFEVRYNTNHDQPD